MSPDYSNAFRYAGAPRWFDFYNCRVILPEQGLFFYIMPFVLSGTAVTGSRAGLYLYEGSNANHSRRSESVVECLGTQGWTAARDRCDMRWGVDQRFTAGHIAVRGTHSTWDVRIRPFLRDQDQADDQRRRADAIERRILLRAPFIHRVPRMKAHASGSIEVDGRMHRFTDAIVYQAKNHGPDLPQSWTWVHANCFSDPGLAVEAASMVDRAGGALAMVRVATPAGVSVLASWLGDSVRVERDGDAYAFEATDKGRALTVSGRGTHRDAVAFTFPSPSSGGFDVDESLVGELAITLNGASWKTGMAALGSAQRSGPGAT